MSLRALAVRAGPPPATRSSLRVRGTARMAKLPSPSWGARPLSAEAAAIRELPGDEPNDVVFESRFGLRTVMLNRPKKYNALTGSMIRKMIPRLVQWERSDMANVVVLKGAGGKALCAGGDVVLLARLNQEAADGWKKSADYFALEYKLDHYIATYQKPFIAFMDGHTMGGGVGLSVHAPFRIATEKTVFAMPETTIGFFPDVGASFFLPRMNGSVGTYLALTSNRLAGHDVFYSGIATHYLHSTSLPALEARLAELRFRDGETLPRRLEIINDTLEEFCTGLPYDQPMQLAGELRQAIDRCFSRDTVDGIVAALGEETGATKEWAQQQLDTLRARSPTAMHVALRQMRVAGGWDLAETFSREHQMAAKFMQHPDFVEGVTALLVRREAPRWKPESLAAVPAGQDVAAPFFEFDDGASLKLLNGRTYAEYPHAALGIPTEREAQAMVGAREYTPEELAAALVASRNGRQGIAEVVREMMARKTTVDGAGKVVWVEDGEQGGKPEEKPEEKQEEKQEDEEKLEEKKLEEKLEEKLEDEGKPEEKQEEKPEEKPEEEKKHGEKPEEEKHEERPEERPEEKTEERPEEKPAASDKGVGESKL